MNIFKRVVAILLAVLMLGMILFQLLSAWASAAVDHNVIVKRNGGKIEYIDYGYVVEIQFDVSIDTSGAQVQPTEGRSYVATSFKVNRGVWSPSSSSSMRIEFLDETSSSTNTWHARVSVSSLKYINSKKSGDLELTSIVLTNIGAIDDIFITLDDSFFERKSSSATDDDDSDLYSSDIIVESVVAKDSNGKTITKISKDTTPFSIEVIYTDRGLWDVYVDDFTGDALYVYLTDAGPFLPNSGTKGVLRTIKTSSGDPPRFRATFDDITYSGGSANYGEIAFRVQYDLYGQDIMGSGVGRLYSVVPDEDDDSEIQPPTPYIIINQYSLGKEQIEAGSTFTLALDFGNTSKDIELENIRMVINPVTIGTTEQSFLSIASATNTYYYDRIPADGRLSQSVDILVKGTATVGSQAVAVDFTYEYVVDKTRNKGDTSTTIYVPITQIDRFSVDPITDYSSYMTVGDEGYATISFVNHGKSATYNISGYILDAEGNQGQTEHYGNLEAGAYGTLDFTLTPSMPGEYNGTIVIIYEDENGEEKEIATNFSAFVEERWFPTPPDNSGMEDPDMMQENPSTPWWRYMLFSVGGLAIASPLALYLAKRVKAKGSEDFNEDF